MGESTTFGSESSTSSWCSSKSARRDALRAQKRRAGLRVDLERAGGHRVRVLRATRACPGREATGARRRTRACAGGRARSRPDLACRTSPLCRAPARWCPTCRALRSRARRSCAGVTVPSTSDGWRRARLGPGSTDHSRRLRRRRIYCRAKTGRG